MRGVGAIIAIALMTGAAVAQQSQGTVPTPSPQQQIMGYFAGDWKLSGTTKVNPKAAAAPVTGTEHGEWVPGQFFLETHSVMKGPMGDVHGTRVMEYNPIDKVYTYNAYNSLGEHQMAVGNVQGNTWTWNAEEKMNGVVVKGRYTVMFLSPGSYKFKSEVLKPGGGWSTVTEGTATRSPSN